MLPQLFDYWQDRGAVCFHREACRLSPWCRLDVMKKPADCRLDVVSRCKHGGYLIKNQQQYHIIVWIKIIPKMDMFWHSTNHRAQWVCPIHSINCRANVSEQIRSRACRVFLVGPSIYLPYGTSPCPWTPHHFFQNCKTPQFRQSTVMESGSSFFPRSDPSGNSQTTDSAFERETRQWKTTERVYCTCTTSAMGGHKDIMAPISMMAFGELKKAFTSFEQQHEVWLPSIQT